MPWDSPDALDDLAANISPAQTCHVMFEAATKVQREELYMTVSNEGGACMWSGGVENDGKAHLYKRRLRIPPTHGKALVGEIARSRSYQIYKPEIGYVGQDEFIEYILSSHKEIVHHITVEQVMH